jgi:hypothetical protein
MFRHDVGPLYPISFILGGLEPRKQTSSVTVLDNVFTECAEQVWVADSEQREFRDAVERWRWQSGILSPVLNVCVEAEDIDETLDLAGIRGKFAGESAKHPADLRVLLGQALRELFPAHLSDSGLPPRR